jgi:hypothetical protein
VGGQRNAPTALPSGKTRYPLYRRLGGTQGRSGHVRKISPPTGIRSSDRPARSESLYRLRYPGFQVVLVQGFSNNYNGPRARACVCEFECALSNLHKSDFPNRRQPNYISQKCLKTGQTQTQMTTYVDTILQFIQRTSIVSS